jgi:taurine--2-oxoglutarate transaminase
VKNRETHEPFVPFNAKGEQAQPMAKLMAHAMSKGLYLSSFSNIIRLSPPLIINRQEMSDACDILDELMMMANDSLKK